MEIKEWWNRITITISMVNPIEETGLLEDQALKTGSTYNILTMNMLPTPKVTNRSGSQKNEEPLEPWAVNIRNDSGNLISTFCYPIFQLSTIANADFTSFFIFSCDKHEWKYQFN